VRSELVELQFYPPQSKFYRVPLIGTTSALGFTVAQSRALENPHMG